MANKTFSVTLVDSNGKRQEDVEMKITKRITSLEPGRASLYFKGPFTLKGPCEIIRETRRIIWRYLTQDCGKQVNHHVDVEFTVKEKIVK
ncbi:hypothetical protein K0B04_00435 [Patescibacteria group bacterium]|nr:hypothetical protein [Patescibacteria group bacterium]